MKKEDPKIETAGTYPQTEGKDSQIQPEFIDDQPNDFQETSLRDQTGVDQKNKNVENSKPE